MITTTNPPEGESEDESQPEPAPTTNPAPWPDTWPELTRNHDHYIDDKFLNIFKHEDRSGALSRIVTEGLSQNDNGAQWAPITSWRDWWQRAKRAENLKGDN